MIISEGKRGICGVFGGFAAENTTKTYLRGYLLFKAQLW
jgi:hypothetical protein